MHAPLLTGALMFACRYPSDDINKFLWMVRIGGGVFPDIKEADYLGPRGYTIDDSAGKVTLSFPLLPGWDWDGKACTNSLLQHGPGLKASTEGGPQATHSARCPCCQLAGSGTTSEACVMIGTSWTAAKRALQLCHAVRRNCRWPGALLQQQHLVYVLCSIMQDCAGKICWLSGP